MLIVGKKFLKWDDVIICDIMVNYFLGGFMVFNVDGVWFDCEMCRFIEEELW